MDATPDPSAQSGPKLDLSRIRHDLRTPINQIMGYCELLQEDDGAVLPTSSRPDLKKIHGGGHAVAGAHQGILR